MLQPLMHIGYQKTDVGTLLETLWVQNRTPKRPKNTHKPCTENSRERRQSSQGHLLSPSGTPLIIWDHLGYIMDTIVQNRANTCNPGRQHAKRTFGICEFGVQSVIDSVRFFWICKTSKIMFTNFQLSKDQILISINTGTTTFKKPSSRAFVVSGCAFV